MANIENIENFLLEKNVNLEEELMAKYELVKANIIMTVINTERNPQLLAQVPHNNKEDLSLIYKVLLKKNDRGIATITVSNEHLKLWDITVEELHELAEKNSKRLLPSCINKMGPMYVITNMQLDNGASTIFYDDTLERISGMLGTDLYILPSSIHEVIAVSINEGSLNMFSETVRVVNSTQVAEKDQLSDNVYYYSAETKDWTLA